MTSFFTELHHVGRRRNERGATFVEAIGVMSVLVILWAGSMHFGRLTVARFRNQEEARRCAWVMAMNGCPDDAAQFGCANPQRTRDPKPEEEFDAVGDAYTDDREPPEVDPGDELSGPTETTGTREADEEVGNEVGAAVEGVLLTRVKTSSEEEIERPPLLGGQTVKVGGKLSLPCNVSPWSLDDVLKPKTGLFEKFKDNDP